MTLSVADDRARRRFRRALVAGSPASSSCSRSSALALSDFDNGRFTMPWWVIELLTNIVLVALAVGLGPFIKRFGRAYAADVFRANPRTGKSYLVLTDVAYYLIFTSFILFTMTFVEPDDWARQTGAQLKHEVARVGGILLIMGVLHAANVVALPVIGRLLANDRQARRATSAAGARGGPGCRAAGCRHVDPADRADAAAPGRGALTGQPPVPTSRTPKPPPTTTTAATERPHVQRPADR